MNRIEVDDRAAVRMFREMDFKNQRQVFRSTLHTCGNILIRQAQKNIRSIDTKNGKIYIKNKSKYTGKTMDRGIKKYVWRNLKGVTVTIAGKDPGIDFRLRFFATGTKDRYTKGHKITGSYWSGGRKYLIRKGKGGYRGRIVASHFFRNAQRQTEPRIFGEMDATFRRHLARINNKYLNKSY